MDLISLIIVLAVVGFVLWLVTTLIPMDATVKKVIVAVVCLILVLWVLQAVVPGIDFHFGRIR
jgi:hypothetical protein